MKYGTTRKYQYLDQQLSWRQRHKRKIQTAVILLFFFVIWTILSSELNNDRFKKRVAEIETLRIDLPTTRFSVVPDEKKVVTTEPEKVQGWRNVTVRPGDNLANIFGHLGISNHQLMLVMSLRPAKQVFTRLFPGDTIRVKIDDHHQLEKLAFQINPKEMLLVTHSSVGDNFVAEIVTPQFPV